MEQTLKKLFERTKQKQRKGMLGSLVSMATIVLGGLVVAVIASTLAHGIYPVIGVHAPGALAMIFMYAVLYIMAWVFLPMWATFIIAAIAIQLFLTLMVYIFALGFGTGAGYILLMR